MNMRIAPLLLVGVVMAGLASMAAAVPPTPPPVRQPPPPNPVLIAQKSVADAMDKLAKAKGTVLTIRKRVAVNYESKPEFKAAKSEYDKAKNDFDLAARAAQVKLEADPVYKSTIIRRDKAQAIVDGGAHTAPTSDDTPKLTDEEVNAARQERINTALELRKMQKDSQENNPAYVAARVKYNDTKAAYDALEQQIDDAVKLDPAYAPAEVTVVQAELALQQARDQYTNAVKAQEKGSGPRPVRTPTPPVRK